MRENQTHKPLFERAFRVAVSFFITALVISDAAVARAPGSDPEPAPIVERFIDYASFTLKTTDGKTFNLREFAKDKRVVIVGYVAGWCENSNNNGHVVKRLHDKYKDRGLGVVLVAEYSDAAELRLHINRVGVDYPVVVETTKQSDRQKSAHYRFRTAVGDKRKWGTPFYVIFKQEDILEVNKLNALANHIYTVSGEIIESEAEQFIEQALAAAG